jgi:hypothetical protein
LLASEADIERILASLDARHEFGSQLLLRGCKCTLLAGYLCTQLLTCADVWQTPEGGHGSHGPWVSDDLAEYGERIIPQFGLYNAQASYPMDEFARWIRINKYAHQRHGLKGMVPWVTTGFDGVLQPPQVLAQAVHMLVGGCTGFNIFSSKNDGDWDSWANMLAFTRAVELVLPYELIIAQGTLAYEQILLDSCTNVLAVSTMTYRDQYLIALSASDASIPMHVVLNTSHAFSGALYRLDDLMSGKHTNIATTGAELRFLASVGEDVALVLVSRL